MKKCNTNLDFKKHLLNEVCLVYYSRLWCGVCHSMREKTDQWIKQYPSIPIVEVNCDELEEISGQQLILSAPTLVLYIAGKEFIRQSAFIRFEPFEKVLHHFN